MSEEDKELLARIGQLAGTPHRSIRARIMLTHLAGQINRHKNHQAGIHTTESSRPQRQRCKCEQCCNPYDDAYSTLDNNSRYRGAPYPTRGGYRVGRQPAHHHRTLHLNNQRASSESTPSTPGASTESQGWVSKTDRHKQLINANVYEKQAQTRAKAMEETRQRKLKQQRGGEKSRFDDFLRHQSAAAGSVANGHANDNIQEILVEGVRFVVTDGGKKLRRAAGKFSSLQNGVSGVSYTETDDTSAAAATPKTAYIAGIRFHRTKTGNLVANRVVKDHRYVPIHGEVHRLTRRRRSGTVKKVDERCKIFSTTGNLLFSTLGVAWTTASRAPPGMYWTLLTRYYRVMPQRSVMSLSARPGQGGHLQRFPERQQVRQRRVLRPFP